MKAKKIFQLVGLLISGVCFGQTGVNQPPSPEKNFVRVESILVPGITNESQISTLSVSEKNIAYTYFDGFGRPVQVIRVQGAPNPTQADIIQLYEYDPFGRQIKTYLPYANVDPLKGKFRENASLTQDAYYTAPPTGVAGTTLDAFALNTFDNSPLNQILEVAPPRDDTWNAEGKKETSYVKFNAVNEVPRWKDFVSNVPARNGFHSANTLSVEEGTDVVGKVSKTYKNFRGQVVMTRVGDATDWIDTHFIYSPAGLLMIVIQPEGVARLATEFDNASDINKQSFLDRWAFQYQYDDQQRQISKRIPGYVEGASGWSFVVYDQWNRVVLTQDPAQRVRNEYLFTKYDRFNRPIITGLYNSSTAIATLRATAATTSGRFETETNSSTGFTLTSTFPTSGIVESNLLTVTYYDNYDFIPYSGWDTEGNSFSFLNITGYPQSTDLLATVKGKITGTKIRVLGGTKWLNSVTRYDKNYQPVQIIAENNMSGLDRTTTRFDFVGKIDSVRLTHTTPLNTVLIREDYAYDHGQRLLSIRHKVNNEPSVLMISKKYNELGQLIEENIHSTDGTTFLQSVDRRYNIRGWITSINNSSLTNDNLKNDDIGDLFGMELKYNQPTFTIKSTPTDFNTIPKHDGNIAAISWKTDSKQPGVTALEKSWGSNMMSIAVLRIHTMPPKMLGLGQRITAISMKR